MTDLLAADLVVTLERSGRPAVRGRLHGSGGSLVLDVEGAAAFAGTGDAPAVKQVAAGLARRGLTVRVVEDGRHLVTLGAVRAPWWQRRFTGSRHIRLASLRGALTSARARVSDPGAVLPDAALLPPPTVWPPAPTLLRRVRRATTTHDPDRGGAARLVLLQEQYLPGERQPVIWLHDGLTIGSAETCDVVLPGVAPQHAVLRHDDQDEWVIEPVAGVTRVHGAPVIRQILRTGARITLGEHQLAFVREEYADHGRPHGGRLGGELGRQRRQPPRPGYDGPDF